MLPANDWQQLSLTTFPVGPEQLTVLNYCMVLKVYRRCLRDVAKGLTASWLAELRHPCFAQVPVASSIMFGGCCNTYDHLQQGCLHLFCASVLKADTTMECHGCTRSQSNKHLTIAGAVCHVHQTLSALEPAMMCLRGSGAPCAVVPLA